MKLQNKLYQINNEINKLLAEHTDEETGEIKEEIIPLLESLEVSRIELTKAVGVSYHEYNNLANQVKAERDRLYTLEKQYKATCESFKNIMDKILGGANFECELFKANYKKSSSFDLDDFTSIEEIPEDFLRVKKELDKVKVKDVYKASGTLPNGVIKIEKNNLNIR